MSCARGADTSWKDEAGEVEGEGEWHDVTWQPSHKLEFLSYERFTILSCHRTNSTMTMVSQSVQLIARTDCVFLVLSIPTVANVSSPGK